MKGFIALPTSEIPCLSQAGVHLSLDAPFIFLFPLKNCFAVCYELCHPELVGLSKGHSLQRSVILIILILTTET
jgi:hypothetical protein